MGKKKDKVNDWLWNLIEVQAWRLKDLISQFYPDGVRIDFEQASQVGKRLMDDAATKRFSEDEKTQELCSDIADNAMAAETTCVDIDFFCSSSFLLTAYFVDYEARIMFKVNPEDEPVYLQQGFEHDGVLLRFLVDSDKKQAYLVLEDFKTRDADNDFFGTNSSFIRLSEFHAIMSGYKYDVDRDYNSDDALHIMLSFSKVEGRCVVEKIYDINVSLIDQLIPPVELNEDTGTPTSDRGSQPEAVNGAKKECPQRPVPSNGKDKRMKILEGISKKNVPTPPSNAPETIASPEDVVEEYSL